MAPKKQNRKVSKKLGKKAMKGTKGGALYSSLTESTQLADPRPHPLTDLGTADLTNK